MDEYSGMGAAHPAPLQFNHCPFAELVAKLRQQELTSPDM
jgi:hypothetical protein